MKPLHDFKCGRCDATFEARGRMGDTIPCPKCNSDHTHIIFLTAPSIKAGEYNPYDALDRTIPDSKPIKSFGNDRRKGGKDTT